MIEGSNHEINAPLLTEVMVHAVKQDRIPVILTFLDKQAAFDSAHKEHILKEAFIASKNNPSQSLWYMAQRLQSWCTYLDEQGSLIGPIHDARGVKQGGILSSCQFQLTTNREIKLANWSGLGVQVGQVHVASAALADDCNPMDTCGAFMQALIKITALAAAAANYLSVPSKTKILVLNTTTRQTKRFPWIDPLEASFEVAGTTIKPTTQATHLGIVRTNSLSNMPAVMARISAHSRALYAVMGVGLAKNHWGNPSASIRVKNLYYSPVLFSGLAALLMSKDEILTLAVYNRKILRQLQKLPKGTPIPAPHYMSGSLPAEALLHQRQFCLFIMVAHLPQGNPLKQIALQNLTQPPKFSWFTTLTATGARYGISEPLQTLQNPPTKSSYKRITKKLITAHWTQHLYNLGTKLPSL